MTLSTHVLDVDAGRPVPGVPVRVQCRDAGSWTDVATGTTDADGRITRLVDEQSWRAGRWRLVFDVAAVHGPQAFYPEIVIDVQVSSTDHHHVPLLLARHGYTTYRGS